MTGVVPSEQTESHQLIEHLMIAANEAGRAAARGAQLPTLYRVHERPDPARVEHLAEQLAALDVPTPPLPEHAVAAAGRRRGRRRSRASSTQHVRAHRPRARGADLARAALAQAGALHAAQPRPLRPALAALLPLHLADPPLPGPGRATGRCWPRSARARTRRRPRAIEEVAEWCSLRERDAMAIERAADDVARCFLLERELFRGRLGARSAPAR